MSSLTIEFERITLDSEVVRVFVDELRDGGLSLGALFIGDVMTDPDTAYILWHASGEIPVSALISRDELANSFAARAAAQDFLSKWNHRYE